MRVAVICGGSSLEREISAKAGNACAKALSELGHDVTSIDAGHDLAMKLLDCKPDAAFNALHGRWGEDGCVQGMLEWMKIPYTHSGVLASALAMNKQKTKLVYSSAGIPSPYSVLRRREEITGSHPVSPPYVVKPINEGSSLGGLYLVDIDNDPAQIPEGEREVFLVERYVPGRELTVTVLGDKALAVSEFKLSGLYDFDAKYKLHESNRILPAKLPKKIFSKLQRLAETAHRALGCRSISRTDFRWNEDLGCSGIFALETNTQPGLRPNSNAGEQAANAGISFPELCEFLLMDSSVDR